MGMGAFLEEKLAHPNPATGSVSIWRWSQASDVKVPSYSRQSCLPWAKLEVKVFQDKHQ